MAVFEKCDPAKSLCLAEEKINEWLSWKYLVTVTNEKHFVQHKFGRSRIIESSDLQWNPIDPNIRSDFVKYITRTELDLKDDYWGLGAHNDSGFYISKKPSRSIPYENRFWTTITFEVSLDQHFYLRTVYSSLDFLSEIGGLFTAFSSICKIIIGALNHYGSFQFVMGDNFYFRSGELYKNDVQWNSLKSIRLNSQLFCPKKLLTGCCEPKKRDRINSRSYDQILRETSVSYIIQQLRVLNAACKETRTNEEW